MYYKMIVYKQMYVKIETARGTKTKVYFKKLATRHGIHKSTLSKEHLQLFKEYSNVADAWTITIDELREDEDEKQTLIYKNNQKLKDIAKRQLITLD